MEENIENAEQQSVELTEFDKKLLSEIKKEHQISAFRNDDETFINYIHEGIADINENNGVKTDYENDIISRRLLKLYVLYADNKRLAEFKSLYSGEYAERQRHYFQESNSNVQ